MSADWFCKIGEKKFGPLNGQQLKTIVAKGQLKPEHLVRRGSEGPWVPAGRIKGLFPEGPAGSAQSQGKKQPQAAGKPSPQAGTRKAGDSPPKAKAASLPTAAEAPVPPAADIPQELRLGGHHKHHVQMNVDSLNIEATPVDVSRRKVKSGLQGLKKEEQKKVTVMLLCLIGGGMTIGTLVIVWAIASGKFSNAEPKKPEPPAALTQAADSGKKTEKEPAVKKPAQETEPRNWPRVSFETVVGNVAVKVLKPILGAAPKGAKTDQREVLVVPVTLELKTNKTKQVKLTSWADDSLKNKVSLKDDQKVDYDLLEQVADKDSDGKTITDKRIKVQLVFEAPTSKKLKYLRLKLPASAFQADGPMIYYEIDYANDIRSEGAKSAPTDKADKSTKPDGGDSAESTPKSDKKKPPKDKPADGGDGNSDEVMPKKDQ